MIPKRIRAFSLLLPGILFSWASLCAAVVGGRPVSEGSQISKSTVAIYNQRDQSFCAGSLISQDVVLTAAHCLKGSVTDFKVIFSNDALATLNSSDSRQKELVRSVQNFKQHPDYLTPDLSKKVNEYGDIGLIKLSAKAPVGFVPVSILEEASLVTVGKAVLVAGYGIALQQQKRVDRYYAKLPALIQAGEAYCNSYKTICHVIETNKDRTLREASVLVDRWERSELYLDESHGRGTCYGDSGGPVFVEHEGVLKLAAITSRGDGFGGCGQMKGIKTGVTFYLPWIALTLQEFAKGEAL